MWWCVGCVVWYGVVWYSVVCARVWVVVDSIVLVDHGHGCDEMVDGDQRESWGIQGQQPREETGFRPLLNSYAWHGC